MLEKKEPPSTKVSKLKILEKYKKDFHERVKFSDISHLLISSNYISKEDCYEICILPVKKQMKLFYEKFLKILENEPENEVDEKAKNKDPWDVLLRSLKYEHPLLSCKLDGALQKLVKTDKPKKLTKDDIGTPLNCKHLQHIGRKPRRFLSLRSTPSVSSTNSVDEGDPDFKAFLSHAGVSTEHLRRPGTRHVILDFIDRNGGMDAIRREIQSNLGTEIQSPCPTYNSSETSSSIRNSLTDF